MSKKSFRNRGVERKHKVSEAEMKLNRMHYYWIFSVIWMVLGAILVAFGLTSLEDTASASVRVGGFIILLALGMIGYGAKMHSSLKERVKNIKALEEKQDKRADDVRSGKGIKNNKSKDK